MPKFTRITREIILRLFFLFLFLLFGLLIANQYILYKRIGLTQAVSDPEGRAVRVSKLYTDNEKLREQLNERSQQKKELEDSASNNTEVQKVLETEKEKYEIVMGQTDIQGKGIVANIGHTMVLTQLVDFINALRNSGAEAIAINDKRIVTTSAMEPFADQPNYQIKVIGNKEVLYDGLTRPGGIFELIINGTAEKSDNIILPKYQ